MVQEETVDTLIKKGAPCLFYLFIFFKKRNENVNGNFSSLLPSRAGSPRGIRIHFGFDSLSSLNAFIQTMWIRSDLPQIPPLLWLIKLTLAKKGLDQRDLKFTWKTARALLEAISVLRPSGGGRGAQGGVGGEGEIRSGTASHAPSLWKRGRLGLDTLVGLADDGMIMLKSFVH